MLPWGPKPGVFLQQASKQPEAYFLDAASVEITAVEIQIQSRGKAGMEKDE